MAEHVFRKERARSSRRFHRTTMSTPAKKKRTTYTSAERLRRRLGPGGAGGDLRNDSVSPGQLPIVNRGLYNGPSGSSNSRSVPNAKASSDSDFSSNFSSDFSSDFSSEDSSGSSGSDAIYTDGDGSDSDDDSGPEDWSDPFQLATEGFRLVHMGKFGKLVHGTIPCTQCRVQRRADLEAVIKGKKFPRKSDLRDAADALLNTPTGGTGMDALMGIA